MSVALLFPGQGTQHPAMLPWLDAATVAVPAAADALQALAQAVGADWRTRLGEDAWAQANHVAQPLVTATSVAAWSVLAPRLPRVVAVAGYSVGELAACVAAGMLAGAQATALASRRAAAMDACAVGVDAGLLSVSVATSELVAAACARWGLEVAIRIAPERCILGGAALDLDAAARQLQGQGAKTQRLGVRVASHTRAMRGAVPALEEALSACAWHPPRAAWVAGSRGAVVRDLAQVRAALAEQVERTVQWEACMATVAERLPDCVLEIGPGTTLARLWRDQHPRIAVRSCEDFASADDVLAWVAREQP